MDTSERLTWRFHLGLVCFVVVVLAAAGYIMISAGSGSDADVVAVRPAETGMEAPENQARVSEAQTAIPEPLVLEVDHGGEPHPHEQRPEPSTDSPVREEPVADAVTEAVEPAPDEPPHVPGPVEKAPTSPVGRRGEWWHGPVTLDTGMFLVEPGMRGAQERYIAPAPIGQQYVFVTLVLTWEGGSARVLRCQSTPSSPASIQLSAGTDRIDPIGRRLPAPDPLTPVSLAPIELIPKQRTECTMVFALPETVTEVDLLLEGHKQQTLAIASPPASPPGSWVGDWRRQDAMIGPLRYGDTLLDALAAPGARVMRIQQRLDGLTLVSIPSASIRADDNVVVRNETSIDIHLTKGAAREAATLRAVERGEVLLLYLGKGRSIVHMYRRCSY